MANNKKKGSSPGPFGGDHTLENVGSGRRRHTDRRGGIDDAPQVRLSTQSAEQVMAYLSNIQREIAVAENKEAARKARVSTQLGKGTCIPLTHDFNIRVAKVKHAIESPWETRVLDDPDKSYLLQVPCSRARGDQCSRCILGNLAREDVDKSVTPTLYETREIAYGIRLSSGDVGVPAYSWTSFYCGTGDPIGEVDCMMEDNLRTKNLANPNEMQETLFAGNNEATDRMFGGDSMF